MEDKVKLEHLRHSAAHLLAAAIMELWPDAKRTIGPAIEDGFYFDFDFGDIKVSEADFPKIEEKMHEIVKSWKGFERHDLSKEDAIKEYPNNEYKAELIEEFTAQGEKVSFYKSGDYWDLCKGGHIDNPSEELKYFKLMKIAGAYWRGSEKNKMLTRIYGTAFYTQGELGSYIHQLEEAKQFDHRKIGQELELFTFADDVGPGLPLWTPKGTVIRDQLENWAKETEKKWGYVRVATPHIAKHTLYETSGHLPYYRNDMYSPMEIDGEEYFLKGMNCPHHHMIYKSSPKSYKDLPLRYAEYGTVYRYEGSGSLFGLMRVRALCQNDAHIYCTEEQAEEEFIKVLQLHEYYYQTLGLTKNDYWLVVGLPSPEKNKYHGNKELWEKAEKIMRSAAKKLDIKTVDDIGGAAFYGPKIDFNIRSSIGREFSISTNQLDLYMPTRFDLDYTDRDGSKKLCAVIHRAPLGSHERFVGFLLEHFRGKLPLWLSPVQVAVLPISEKHMDYAQKVNQELIASDIRSELDESAERLQAKIRTHTLQKVPFLAIIGDREQESGSVSIRTRDGEDLGSLQLADFLTLLKEKIDTKSI